jgi:hypothetical protein
MNRFKFMFALGAVLMLSVLPVAQASETYVCTVIAPQYDAGTPASTDGGIGGRTDFPIFGTTCSWGTQATIAVQCSAPVYYRVRGASVTKTPGSTPVTLSDAGTVFTNMPQATDVDVNLTWGTSANTDPYIIMLGRDEKVVSVQGAGAVSTCNFYQLSNQPVPAGARR